MRNSEMCFREKKIFSETKLIFFLQKLVRLQAFGEIFKLFVKLKNKWCYVMKKLIDNVFKVAAISKNN